MKKQLFSTFLKFGSIKNAENSCTRQKKIKKFFIFFSHCTSGFYSGDFRKKTENYFKTIVTFFDFMYLLIETLAIEKIKNKNQTKNKTIMKTLTTFSRLEESSISRHELNIIRGGTSGGGTTDFDDDILLPDPIPEEKAK